MIQIKIKLQKTTKKYNLYIMIIIGQKFILYVYIIIIFYQNLENMGSKKPEEEKGRLGYWIRMRNPHLVHKNQPKAKFEYEQSQIKFELDHEILMFDKILPEWFSNHEVYEKVCNNLIKRILEGKNQTYIICGDEQERLDTFLGNGSDPGLFLIIMIYLLQEKYKHEHGELSIKIELFEYSNGEFYDLLNTATIPLKLMKRGHFLEGTNGVLINEYIQFLRILKIGLYNNKSRDFKVNRNEGKPAEKESVFMSRIIVHSTVMNINSSVNNNIVGNISNGVNIQRPSLVSSLLLVDFPNEGMKNKDKSGVKDEWVHIVSSIREKNLRTLKKMEDVTINNSGSNSSNIRIFMEDHLRDSYNATIIYCMSPLQETISTNIEKMRLLKEVDGVVLEHKKEEILLAHFIEVNLEKYQPVEGNSNNLNHMSKARFISNSLFLEHLQTVSKNILLSISKGNQYKSINHLEQIKKGVSKSLEMMRQQIMKLCAGISNIILTKIKLSMQNKINYVQLKELIGKCIKTENISQFYTSKTYQSLYREVKMKTEETSKKIDGILEKLYEYNEEVTKCMKSSLRLCRQLGAKFQDPTYESIIKELLVLYKQILVFLNGKIKRVNQMEETQRIWLEKSLWKLEFDMLSQRITQVFKQFLAGLYSPDLEDQCSFKQLQFISKNNLIYKTTEILKGLYPNNNTSNLQHLSRGNSNLHKMKTLQSTSQGTSVFPKLLFNKLEQVSQQELQRSRIKKKKEQLLKYQQPTIKRILCSKSLLKSNSSNYAKIQISESFHNKSKHRIRLTDFLLRVSRNQDQENKNQEVS